MGCGSSVPVHPEPGDRAETLDRYLPIEVGEEGGGARAAEGGSAQGGGGGEKAPDAPATEAPASPAAAGGEGGRGQEQGRGGSEGGRGQEEGGDGEGGKAQGGGPHSAQIESAAPTTQSTQVLTAVVPKTPEYLPAFQSVQTEGWGAGPAAGDPIEAQDFVRGLHLHAAVLAGIVGGLGLEGPNDHSDVSAALRGLHAAGVESFFRQHCLPGLLACFSNSVDELRAVARGRENVAHANMRYAHDPEGYGAMMGNIDDFEGGFTEFNGAPFPDEDVLSQMQAEFACDEEFTTDGLTTTLRKEWEFTVAPVEGKVYPGEVSLPRGDGTFYPGRNRKDIKDLMKLATSIEGKLVREEVIAVRLYTGPAFLCLNKGLREGGLKAKKKGIQNFPATCAALNSAIKKLRVVTQLPKMRKLFFGIRGLALPQKVLESASFVNFAYTSATPNIVVAREYAGGKHASLFEIQVGQIDRGAFIGEFSYYSEEEEYVLAPMAHYEIVGKRIEGGVNIYELRLNVIGKTETLQELRENRKRQVLAVTDSLNQDCLRLTGHDSLQVAKIVKAEIEPVGYEWFNQGSNFSQILVKLEDALLRELEEKQEAMRQAAGRELLGTEAQVECTVDALLQELEVEQEALPHALPETKAQAERTATLRTCVQLAKRCSAGDADGRRAVLAAQELLVASMSSQGPAAMGSTAAAADDLVELASQLEETANDYPRALEILERALRAKKALQPPALEADVALIFHRQGRVLWRMGRLDEALVQYREALKIRTRLFGYEDRDVAASYNNIALLYENQGKYEEALEAHHKALEIRTRVSGPQHPSVADSHNNIALVYENQRKYDEALESHKKALEIRTRAFGSQHPQDAAISYFNTGLVYRTLGNAKEAKEMFTKSYYIFLKVFGPYHPRTKMSKHNQSQTSVRRIPSSNFNK